MAWILKQENQEILKGDKVSISVIFNNLSGKNFDSSKKHQTYINQIAIKQLGFSRCFAVELYNCDKLIDKCTISY